MVKRGVPSVILVTERFTSLAKATRTGKGMPDLPTVVMPLNPQFYTGGDIERVTEALLGDIVNLIMPEARKADAAKASEAAK